MKSVFISGSEENQKNGRSESLLRSVSSRDAVTATPFIAAASLGILSSSALASMSATVGTGDAAGKSYSFLLKFRIWKRIPCST